MAGYRGKSGRFKAMRVIREKLGLPDVIPTRLEIRGGVRFELFYKGHFLAAATDLGSLVLKASEDPGVQVVASALRDGGRFIHPDEAAMMELGRVDHEKDEADRAAEFLDAEEEYRVETAAERAAIQESDPEAVAEMETDDARLSALGIPPWVNPPRYEDLLSELKSAILYIETYGGEVTSSFAAGGNLARVKEIIRLAEGKK